LEWDLPGNSARNSKSRLTAIHRLESGRSPAEEARALEVNPTELYRWRRELEKSVERTFSGLGNKRAYRKSRVGPAQSIH
jgi:transposase-like protein